MKLGTMLLTAAMLVFMATASFGQACPADKAAEKGHNAFEEFHHVMAPAWHTAYPEKDYAALLAAGPKFAEVFTVLEVEKPEFSNEYKKARYEKQLAAFKELVTAYAAAAEAGDTSKVYELMPDVHTAFERTASATFPVTYKEFSALTVALGLITDKHLPENNEEGIVGSTDRLVEVAGLLNEETLPQMLVWDSEEVLAELAKMKELVAEMKKCCDEKDMDAYRTHAASLTAEASAFEQKYL